MATKLNKKQHEAEVAKTLEQNRQNQLYIEKKKAFLAEATALCKKYGFDFNTAGNILHFAQPDKYTREQLDAAFKRVQPAGSWKNPINKEIYLDHAEIELIGDAVVYFAGCVAEFVPVRGKPKNADGKTLYRVVAAGYYAAVGA